MSSYFNRPASEITGWEQGSFSVDPLRPEYSSQNPGSMAGDKSYDWGGFASDFGSVAKGAGGLIGSYLAWQNMKDLKVARERDMAFQREQYDYAKAQNERNVAQQARSRAIQAS